jgi:NAD(P)H-dependent flavin oxidoreductase YrpB (nitropropane dioxygenase family)
VSAKIDGAPQRVIRTDFIDQLERSPWWRLLPRAMANAHAFRKESGMSLFALGKEGWSMLKSKEVNLTRLVLAANAPVMTKAALIDGRLDVGILPTGQVVGLIEKIPTVAEIIDGMIEQANEVLDRLAR